MNQAEAIEKINKCLELANSSNANEAATALRQAQKLMEKYGVDDMDLKFAKFEEMQARGQTRVSPKLAPWLEYLVNIIRNRFGVKCVLHYNKTSSAINTDINYFGETVRVKLAVYAHDVLYRNAEKAWAEHKAIFDWDTKRQDFIIGWLTGVENKLEKLHIKPEEVELRNAAYSKKYPAIAIAKNVKEKELDADAYYAGARAGKNFDVHVPMDGAEQHAQLENKGD